MDDFDISREELRELKRSKPRRTLIVLLSIITSIFLIVLIILMLSCKPVSVESYGEAVTNLLGIQYDL